MVATVSRRTTSSRLGTARGHSRLVQISSLPEVSFQVKEERDSSHVQASARRVRSRSVTVTARPATASVTFGRTTTSSGAQLPCGSGRAGWVGSCFFCFF